jgi:hypothetical protein
MLLKTENSRRVAKSRSVCMDLYSNRNPKHYLECYFQACVFRFASFISVLQNIYIFSWLQNRNTIANWIIKTKQIIVSLY